MRVSTPVAFSSLDIDGVEAAAIPNRTEEGVADFGKSQLLAVGTGRGRGALLQREKEKGRGGTAGSGGGGVAAVVDLRASSGSSIAPSGAPKTSFLQPRKAFVPDGPPLSFIPSAAKEEQILIFGEVVVENEYDPMVPNDFNQLVEAQTERKKAAREEAREREEETRAERRRERSRREEERELEEEERKRQRTAAIAPPTALLQADARKLAEPTVEGPSQGGFGGGLSAAARMMEKMGYKKGGGLGRQQQGRATALQVENTWRGGGRIVDKAAETPKEEPVFLEPSMPPPQPQGEMSVLPPGNQPPPPEPTPITELLKNPTKCLLLKNMVGLEGVDNELEGEVREEMAKYGEVVKVLIYQMPQPCPDYEAVRVFVEFAKVDQAIKAVVDLNGRFFAGRTVRAGFYDVEAFARFDLAR